MKAKRRYVAQNVFHARTLPGLGNARITRLAAQGDAIPLRGVENKHTAALSLSPHGTHAGRSSRKLPASSPRWPCRARARTPGSRRAWQSRRIPRLPGQAPPRSAPSCTLPCEGNRPRRPRARCTPRAPWSPRPRAARRLRGFRTPRGQARSRRRTSPAAMSGRTTCSRYFSEMSSSSATLRRGTFPSGPCWAMRIMRRIA